MNQFLANALGQLNALAAVVIMLGAAVAGGFAMTDSPLGGAILGLTGGFLLAIVVCGLLALIITIQNTLESIDQRLMALSESLSQIPTHPKSTNADCQAKGAVCPALFVLRYKAPFPGLHPRVACRARCAGHFPGAGYRVNPCIWLAASGPARLH